MPLKGRSYTWSNMQDQPLMQKLDWFFTSPAWTLSYPNTMVIPLTKSMPDHTPRKIQIRTHIPKETLFRFENYWVMLPGFIETVSMVWISSAHPNKGINFSAKLKATRMALKKWNGRRSNFSILIKHCNIIIAFLDDLKKL